MHKILRKKKASAKKPIVKRTDAEKARILIEVARQRKVGLDVANACRAVGIAESQYYDWRKKGLDKYAAMPDKPVPSNVEEVKTETFDDGEGTPTVKDIVKSVLGTTFEAEQAIEINRLVTENRRLKLMYMDLLLESQS